MSYVILRTAKLKSMGNIGGSLAHTYRTRDTPNAIPDREHLNSHELAGPEEVKAAIAARLPEKRRSDAVLCVEYVITASPDYFTEGQDKDGSAYFADALKWLKAKHGAENVVATSIHHDEKSPHLVAYVVPLDDQGKLNAKAFLGGKAKLSAMQTEFAHEVGRKHGLERGVEGSRATHTTIREYYGRIGQAQEKTPSVDVPEPSMGDRLNPKAYGERVAKAVIEQMAPELRALRAKAAENDGLKREVREARRQLANTEFLRKQMLTVAKTITLLNADERGKFDHLMEGINGKVQVAAKARKAKEVADRTERVEARAPRPAEIQPARPAPTVKGQEPDLDR
jgi:hypothetical protein